MVGPGPLRRRGGERILQVPQQPEQGQPVLRARRFDVLEAEGELLLLDVLVGAAEDIVGCRRVGIGEVFGQRERAGILRGRDRRPR